MERPVTLGFVGYLRTLLPVPEALATIAKLPSRDELLSQLVGVLQAPLQQLVGVLEGPQRDLVSVITNYEQKLKEGN